MPLLWCKIQWSHITCMANMNINPILYTELNDLIPLQIAVLCNRTDVAHQLIWKENQHMKYKGNLHLFQILTDLRQFEMFTNECSVACDVSVQHRKRFPLYFICWFSFQINWWATSVLLHNTAICNGDVPYLELSK
jgi:hypothetical protein